jgi:hypothetical protein
MLTGNELILLILSGVIAGFWMYSVGYKDGKREGHMQASKYRKAANNG